VPTKQNNRYAIGIRKREKKMIYCTRNYVYVELIYEKDVIGR